MLILCARDRADRQLAVVCRRTRARKRAQMTHTTDKRRAHTGSRWSPYLLVSMNCTTISSNTDRTGVTFWPAETRVWTTEETRESSPCVVFQTQASRLLRGEPGLICRCEDNTTNGETVLSPKLPKKLYLSYRA
eukprot:3936716-Rhodomonas_salina.5